MNSSSGENTTANRVHVTSSSAPPEPSKPNAITLICPPPSEKTEAITLDALANGFSTLVGALVGAFVAYYLQKLLMKRQEERSALMSAHKTIFSILQQVNTIILIQRDHIHPYLEDPLRYISIRPTAPFALNSNILSRDDLSFLIETKEGRAIMYEIYMAQENYVEALNQWNLRSEFHAGIIQPALASSGITSGSAVSESDLQRILGDLNHGIIKNATENCIESEQRAFSHLYLCKNKVRQYAVKRFKTNDFTDYAFPDTYGLNVPS